MTHIETYLDDDDYKQDESEERRPKMAGLPENIPFVLETFSLIVFAITIFLVVTLVLRHIESNRLPEKKPKVAIQFTSEAIARIKDEMRDAKCQYFRIKVAADGCAGKKYQLSLETEKKTDDTELEINDVKVLVEIKDERFLNGAIIDYVTLGPSISGYTIVNPNVPSQCGCTSSHE